jgi:two-component system response regulator QseB
MIAMPCTYEESRTDLPILLVEHHLPLARPVMRGCEEEGIVAHLAGDDNAGAALARACSYAALIVDWNIPRSGGTALVRKLRREGFTAPILMLMPPPRRIDMEEALDAGVDEFLPLPFSLEELLACLRTWTEPLSCFSSGITATSAYRRRGL